MGGRRGREGGDETKLDGDMGSMVVGVFEDRGVRPSWSMRREARGVVIVHDGCWKMDECGNDMMML